MNKTIYEAKAFYGISPTFVMLCVIVLLIVLVLAFVWKKVDIGVRCFGSIIALFCLFIALCQIYMSIDAKRSVYDEYTKGNYLVAEGTIYDYFPAEEGEPNLPDRFSVSEVEFQVPGFVSAWGYPLKQNENGLLENGMHVRIYYIEYRFENVIMKIELVR